MPTQDPNHPVKLAVTYAGLYGSQLVATVINTFAYGFAFSIVLQYFNNHAKRDPAPVKIVVGILLVLATLETIFTTYDLYDTFVLRFGKPELQDDIAFSVPGKFLLVFLTAFVAQLFFASHIWTVGKSFGSQLRFLTIPVILIALLQISGGLAEFSLMASSGTFSKLTTKTGMLIEVTAIQGGASAACDLVISAALCFMYYRHRSASEKINSLINRLMVYALNRATATSLCALLNVFLYYYCSGTYYFLIPLLANTHLYVISVVTVLTSREWLREVMGGSNFQRSDSRAESVTTTGMDKKSRDGEV